MNKKRVLYLISTIAILTVISSVVYFGLIKKTAELIPDSSAKVVNNQKDSADSSQKPSETQKPAEDKKVGIPVGAMVGFKAPEFEQGSLSGSNISLSTFKGKPVLVTFWRAGSSESEEQLDKLNELDNMQDRPSDLIILAIDYMDAKDLIKQTINGKNYKFNILLDSNQKASESYGITTLPTTFLIDTDGVINQLWTSVVDAQDMLDKANQMEDEQ